MFWICNDYEKFKKYLYLQRNCVVFAFKPVFLVSSKNSAHGGWHFELLYKWRMYYCAKGFVCCLSAMIFHIEIFNYLGYHRLKKISDLSRNYECFGKDYVFQYHGVGKMWKPCRADLVRCRGNHRFTNFK